MLSLVGITDKKTRTGERVEQEPPLPYSCPIPLYTHHPIDRRDQDRPRPAPAHNPPDPISR
ncbi:hypothetical protein GCM10028774_63130 [Spirosoma jeollabukense]